MSALVVQAPPHAVHVLRLGSGSSCRSIRPHDFELGQYISFSALTCALNAPNASIWPTWGFSIGARLAATATRASSYRVYRKRSRPLAGQSRVFRVCRISRPADFRQSQLDYSHVLEDVRRRTGTQRRYCNISDTAARCSPLRVKGPALSSHSLTPPR